MRCKEEILNLARDVSVTKKLTDKRDMLDWPQKTIYKFYEFCLKQTVIPTLDLDNITLELVGIKDGVRRMLPFLVKYSVNVSRYMKLRSIFIN